MSVEVLGTILSGWLGFLYISKVKALGKCMGGFHSYYVIVYFKGMSFYNKLCFYMCCQRLNAFKCQMSMCDKNGFFSQAIQINCVLSVYQFCQIQNVTTTSGKIVPTPHSKSLEKYAVPLILID